jgi:fucose 4-O-acetylase-like acetyltransferase
VTSPTLTSGRPRPDGRPGQAAAPQAPSPARDAYFDNAKLLAIVLVVMGHSWEPLRHSRAIWAGYVVVFLLHMPAFIVISGYFSRTFAYRPRQIERLVSGLLVPYLVFEAAYTVYGDTVDHRHNSLSLIAPWYLTWFLMALLVWRMTAPLWRAVRWPFTTAVVLSVLAASSHLGPELTLDRVFQFLPFFVLGLKMRPGHWEMLRARWVRAAAVPVFAGALAAAYWAKPRMSARWTYRGKDWGELHASAATGLAMQLGLLAVSVALVACFLAWVPRRRTWFTALGRNTLYVYLLHGFLVRGLSWRGGYDHAFLHTPLGEIAVTAVAVTVALALSTPPVRRVFHCVMEPDLGWAFRPQPADGHAGSGRGGDRSADSAAGPTATPTVARTPADTPAGLTTGLTTARPAEGPAPVPAQRRDSPKKTR